MIADTLENIEPQLIEKRIGLIVLDSVAQLGERSSVYVRERQRARTQEIDSDKDREVGVGWMTCVQLEAARGVCYVLHW